MRSIVCIALATVAVAAADTPTGSAHAVRIVLQAMPGAYEAENEAVSQNGTRTVAEDGSWDSTGRMAIGYQWTVDRAAPSSFILGAGLAFSEVRDGNGAGKIAVSESGAFIEAGVAWHAARAFTVEGAARIGFGVASAEVQTDSGTTDYDLDGYGELGLEVRGVFRLRSGFEFGIGLGLYGQRARVEQDEDGVERALTLDTVGATLGIIVGRRF